MTAELLEDTASNIMAYINKWIAKKTKATRNAMILKVLNEMTKGKEVTVENLDSLKDIFNEQLDPAIADNAVVITNQSGFNYLDKLRIKTATIFYRKTRHSRQRERCFSVNILSSNYQRKLLHPRRL